MTVCSVLGCCNRSARKSVKQKIIEKNRNITFHGFPKNVEKRNAWLKAIGRTGWNPPQKSVICSDHFTEESFDRTSLCYVRLRESAVPTILKPADTTSISLHVSGIEAIIKAETSSDLSASNYCQDQEISENLNVSTLSHALQITDVRSIAIAGSSSDYSGIARTSALSHSKQSHIKTISRTTSFSPLRRMTRQISPNKFKSIDERYKLKIKRLQQRLRRSIKKIAAMSSVLHSLEA